MDQPEKNPLISAKSETQILCEFLATRDIDHHPDRTLLSGVRQVPPGSLLRVRARRGLGAGLETTESRYYHLSPPEQPLRPLSPLLVDETRALLTDALRQLAIPQLVGACFAAMNSELSLENG